VRKYIHEVARTGRNSNAPPPSHSSAPSSWAVGSLRLRVVREASRRRRLYRNATTTRIRLPANPNVSMDISPGGRYVARELPSLHTHQWQWMPGTTPTASSRCAAV
jgi:hypothetical protein